MKPFEELAMPLHAAVSDLRRRMVDRGYAKATVSLHIDDSPCGIYLLLNSGGPNVFVGWRGATPSQYLHTYRASALADAMTAVDALEYGPTWSDAMVAATLGIETSASEAVPALAAE